MPIKAFLFDVGNVLLRFDFSIADRAYAEQSTCGGSPIAMIADLTEQLEDGSLGSEDFLELAIERMGFEGDEEDFVAIWQDIFEPNQPVWDVVESLHGRCPLHLLSNTSGIHHRGFVRDFKVFSRFEDGVFSYSAGCAKPEPAIYTQAIEELELDPGSTFYLDDLEENVEAGREAGFDAFHYDPDNHQALVDALRERGVLEG